MTDHFSGRSPAVRAEAEQLAERIMDECGFNELCHIDDIPDIEAQLARLLVEWGETQYQQGRAEAGKLAEEHAETILRLYADKRTPRAMAEMGRIRAEALKEFAASLHTGARGTVKQDDEVAVSVSGDSMTGRSAVRAEAEQLAERCIDEVYQRDWDGYHRSTIRAFIADLILKSWETQYQQGRAAGMVPTCVACVNGDHVQCLGGRCECIHDPISSSR